MVQTNSFSTNATSSAVSTSSVVGSLAQQVQQLAESGVQGFQGFSSSGGSGVQGFQGTQGSVLSSSFYGATGTVSVGTGATASSPTFASVNPLFLLSLYSNVTYSCIDFSVSSSTTDFYTVPTGKKAIMFVYTLNNLSGTSNSSYLATKISSSYYRIDAYTLVTSTASYGTVGGTFFYVFTEGQTAAIVTTETSNIRVVVFYCEFPDSIPLFSAIKYSGWVAGNNTLYTNTSYNCLINPSFTVTIEGSPLVLVNSSGASATYTIYNVPSSGSVSNQYIYNTKTLANNTASQVTNYMILANGSSVVINSTSSSDTQIAYMTFQGF